MAPPATIKRAPRIAIAASFGFYPSQTAGAMRCPRHAVIRTLWVTSEYRLPFAARHHQGLKTARTGPVSSHRPLSYQPGVLGVWLGSAKGVRSRVRSGNRCWSSPLSGQERTSSKLVCRSADGQSDCGLDLRLVDPAHDHHGAIIGGPSVGLVRVMCGRRPRCKKNLTCSLRSGASHVSGLFARHHDRWP
jgi:hypothetical protein